jgi:hypothetical protein
VTCLPSPRLVDLDATVGAHDPDGLGRGGEGRSAMRIELQLQDVADCRRTVSRLGGRGASASRKVGAPQSRVLAQRVGATRRTVPQRTDRRWLETAQARVKRCGKSAPATGRPVRLGKPHPEQGQAGDMGCSSARETGHSPGRPRRWMVTPPAREDRTPPTGRLTVLWLVCEVFRAHLHRAARHGRGRV